jgi:hypothetical protein
MPGARDRYQISDTSSELRGHATACCRTGKSERFCNSRISIGHVDEEP